MKVWEKLANVREKGYISTGLVKSLTSYFAVAKGDSDIWMVYDASASGLNACLWVPTFTLPSADSLLDLLTPKSWMSDLNMGEQFLNFPLHEDLQVYCGIDVRLYFGAGMKSTLWMRWNRCLMGLRSSPYIATKASSLGEEVALGDKHDVTNPMHWETIQLNLPGSSDYDPTMPWVR